MSDWGERAHRAAEALDMEAIEATDPEDVQYGFREGARWQREALLSEETVMRAARAVYESAPNKWSWTWEQIVDGWKNKPYPDYPHLVDDMRRQAMAALTAAIGDDDE